MSLKDSIKKAAQQQSLKNDQNTEHNKKKVHLGAGRISRFERIKDGRPTNESCEDLESGD